MKSGNRGNALLVELLIVLLFFMLCATVLVRVFAASSALGREAGITVEALARAQGVADRLYLADDPQEVLKEQGFTLADGLWTAVAAEYTLLATLESDEGPAGILFSGEVSAIGPEGELFRLPWRGYREGQRAEAETP